MIASLNVLDSGGGRSGGETGGRCGNGLEKIYPTTAVRFGYMKHIGEFKHPPEMKYGCACKVVIKTDRGIEIGEQVSLTCSGCAQAVTREQIQTYIHNSGPEYYQLNSGVILREATLDDLREEARLRADTPAKRDFCQGLADRLKLPLKVVECEHLLGGERIIFFFLAEGRVDFRSLVKDLAAEYQTRIEMRQVGVRDEARLLADYETCGRECCCKAFLKTLRPVSMKMAKMQKATLDPSKVSGRCSRLKCCLRYEHVAYEELDQNLPKIGTRLSTAHGEGVVVNRQILTQLVQLQAEDGGLLTVAIEDVKAILGKEPVRPRAEASPAAAATESAEAEPEPAAEMEDAPEIQPKGSPPVEDLPKSETPTPAEGPAPSSSQTKEKPDRRRKRRRRRRRGNDRANGSAANHEGPPNASGERRET